MGNYLNRNKLKGFALITAALFFMANVTGCAPQATRPDSSGDVPQQPSEDEVKLISESERAAAEMQRKGLLYDNDDLLSYVREIGARVAPNETDKLKLQFYVIRDPMVNAFAFPTGHIYVTIGLLAKLQNEAQLAFILGHEIAHVAQQHSLEALQNRKAQVVAAHVADLLLFGTSLAYLPFSVSISSYSRSQEDEADEVGLAAAAKAGYDVTAVLQIFDVMNETKDTNALKGSIFADHPTNDSRQRNMRELVEDKEVVQLATAEIGENRYAPIKAGLMQKNVELKLREKQYELTIDAAELALQHYPDDPVLYYYRGEARRLMGADPKGAAREHSWLYGKSFDAELILEIEKQRDSNFTDATTDFRKALSLDSKYALAQRGLGLIAHTQGDSKAAVTFLEAYLSTGNSIKDGRYIRSLLKGIKDDN
ncbi:M48 family metalloprotease [Pseudomonadota bacterium]